MSPIHRRILSVLFAVAASPLVGWAHPGHGPGGERVESTGPVHYLIQPAHSLPLAAIVAATIIVSIALMARRRKSKPSLFGLLYHRRG